MANAELERRLEWRRFQRLWWQFMFVVDCVCGLIQMVGPLMGELSGTTV